MERREHPGSEATTPFVTITSYDRYADASACGYGKGKACEVRTATVTRASVGGQLASPQVRQFTAFDNAGRATTGTTQFEGRSFASTTSFDANGRVDVLLRAECRERATRTVPSSAELSRQPAI